MEKMQYIFYGLVISIALLVVMDYALALPDVHISHSTGNCVGVTTYHGAFFDSLGYSCENMQTKYNHVWAE